MSATVLYMSMSLDGFIAGPNVGPDNGLGDGGHRLHEWCLPGGGDDFEAAVARLRGVNRQIYDEAMSRGPWWPDVRPSSPPAAGAATITTVCPFTSSAVTRHPPGRPNGLPCTM